MMFPEVSRELDMQNHIEYLDQISESLDKEYNDFISYEDELVLENSFLKSIYNNVKTIIRALIKRIIDLWHTFINKVKTLIKWIINKFKSLFTKFGKSDIKIKDPIRTSFCYKDNDTPELYNVYSVDDLYKKYSSAMYSLEKELEVASKENIRLAKYAATRQRQYIQECYDAGDTAILQEIALYYDTKRHELNPNDRRKYSSNMQGSTIFDQYFLENIKILSKEDFDEIRELQKLQLKIREALTDKFVTKFIAFFENNKYYSEKFGTEFSSNNQALQALYGSIMACKADPVMVKAMFKNAINGYFPTDDYGDKQLNLWFTLRYNHNRAVMRNISNMLKLNHMACSISLKEMESMTEDLENNWDTTSFYNFIRSHKDQIISSDGTKFDFSKLGLGIFIVSKEMAMRKVNNPIDKIMDFDYCDSLLEYISRYNVTAVAHEIPEKEIGIPLPRLFERFSNIEKKLFKELYSDEFEAYCIQAGTDNIESISDAEDRKIRKRLSHYFYQHMSKDEFNDYYESLTDDEKSKITILNKKFSFINGVKSRVFFKEYSNDRYARWTITDELYTPSGTGPFTDVELFVYQLLKEGYKKINILSCNKMGFDIYERLLTKYKAIIVFSTDKTMM